MAASCALLCGGCTIYNETLLFTDKDSGAASSGGADAGKGGEGTAGSGGGGADGGAGTGADASGGGSGPQPDGGPPCESMPEICNGEDDDCDGLTDEVEAAEACAFDNGTALCVRGKCTLASCAGDWVDCDGEPGNGCEGRLDERDNCGACGRVCDLSHAEAGCDQSKCIVQECDRGWGDCNLLARDGCERELPTDIRCGECALECDLPDVSVHGCDQEDDCAIIACQPGYSDCDGEAGNGCETQLGTESDCGDCDDACTGTTPFCSSGTCSPVNCSQQRPGYADCNGDGIDCEIDLSPPDPAAAIAHCGACEAACGPLDNATASCAYGSCVIHECEPGYEDCNGGVGNGCETQLGTASDCSECSDTCVSPTPYCSGGVCSAMDCESEAPGYADCNGDGVDCEILLGTDDNCNGCGDDCVSPTPTCAGGVCTGVNCPLDYPGYADCNNDGLDCETLLGTDSNCNGCGDDCVSPTPYCSDGVCSAIDCEVDLPGYGDCDGDGLDCETDLSPPDPATTIAHCGACGTPCGPLSNARVTCATGACAFYDCDVSWVSCDDNTANGCETPASPGCLYPQSCLVLKQGGQDSSGNYTIDPDGSGPLEPFETYCDMTTDGGGWTEITLDIARNQLSGTMVAVQAADTAAFDGSHRPYTVDSGPGSQINAHTYHYTFSFPPGYTQFYLNSYKLRTAGSGTSEIDPAIFVQTAWTLANKPVPVCEVGQVGNVGDISFGTPDNAGPTTGYCSQGSKFECTNCEQAWPGGSAIFTQVSSTAFRIGWGEAGCGQEEGWYPWWSGTIRLR